MSDTRHTTHDDLLPLIEALVNGTIDDAGFARLDEMLSTDPAARAVYRRYVNLHTALGDVVGQQPHLSLKLPGDTAQALTLSPDDSTLGGERFAELLASLEATEDDPPRIVDLSEQLQACARQAREARLAQRRATRSQAVAYVREVALDTAKSPRLYAGLAALVALAVTAWALLPTGSAPAPTADHRQTDPAPAFAQPVPVATLTGTHDAQWSAYELSAGDTLYAKQRLTLTDGFAQITTRRGAVAILEAPATIAFTDHENTIALHEGKLVGLCHTEASKGFVVKTARADITDLGTEFGVRVNKDAVDLSVFVGEIEVATSKHPPRRLESNQGASLAISNPSAGLVVHDDPIRSFARRLPRPALVEAVQFSVDGLEANVEPQSFYADAQLYLNRNYRPAVGTDADLPAALLGADIVQMPIKAFIKASKLDAGIQVSLTVSRPANVYLLVPPNARPGPWLERDYRLTDMKMRFKSGDGTDPIVNKSPLQIWQRRAPVAGTSAVAGSLSGNLNRGSEGMYTMVVQPVESEPENSTPDPIN